LCNIFAALVALHEVEAGFTFRNDCGNAARNLKACLHLQFLLRFSSSDGCERVDKL
jgi:hypothetical protein